MFLRAVTIMLHNRRQSLFQNDDRSDKQYSDEDMDCSPDQSFDRECQLEALIESQVRDWISIGCGCEEKYHHVVLLECELVTYVQGLRQISRPNPKQYVQGGLAASLLPPTATNVEHRYYYSILNVQVCQKLFSEVYGLGKHTIELVLPRKPATCSGISCSVSSAASDLTGRKHMT